jgi:hypothetical protein
MAQLLFILHDSPSGRAGARNKTLISAHTLEHNRKLKYRFKLSGSLKARQPALESRKKSRRESEIDLQASEGGTRRSPVSKILEPAANMMPSRVDPVQRPDDSLRLTAAPSGPIVCGRNWEDIERIGQWYFLSQLHGTHASYFRHAHNHFTNRLWEMAQLNQTMFASVVALASYREVSLATGVPRISYIQLKGQTICQIGKDLSNKHTRTDPLTLVAIVVLAYMDIRDDHFEAARVHLLAFCNLVNITEIPACAWLPCAWIDLRFALLTSQPPILPRHIPISFRRTHSCRVSTNLRTIQRASRNVANCTQTKSFNHHVAFDLFNGLHSLCLVSGQHEESDDPPFGQIYDLEYALRITQSEVAKEREPPCHTAAAAELTVLAVQLHVWMVCRFWTPQRRESHLACISRASSILDERGPALVQHIDIKSMESLLWILFTVVAMMRIHGDCNLTLVLNLLRSVANTLGIHRHKDFDARLAEWPWISDWHPSQTVHVWTMLTERFDDIAAAAPDAHHLAAPTVSSSELPRRLFLGGLEFFYYP